MADRQDLVSGAAIVGVGLLFAAGAFLELPVGRATRMGPGYFPLVLSGLLTALGLLIVVRAFGRAGPASGPFSWRGFCLVPLAVILFSLLVRRLGLAPALLAATFVTAYSSRSMTFARAALLAVGLTLLCALIFKWGLAITPPLFGRS